MGTVRFGETVLENIPDVFLVWLDRYRDDAFRIHGQITFRIKSGGEMVEHVVYPYEPLVIEFKVDGPTKDQQWINESIGELLMRGTFTQDHEI